MTLTRIDPTAPTGLQLTLDDGRRPATRCPACHRTVCLTGAGRFWRHGPVIAPCRCSGRHPEGARAAAAASLVVRGRRRRTAIERASVPTLAVGRPP